MTARYRHFIQLQGIFLVPPIVFPVWRQQGFKYAKVRQTVSSFNHPWWYPMATPKVGKTTNLKLHQVSLHLMDNCRRCLGHGNFIEKWSVLWTEIISPATLSEDNGFRIYNLLSMKIQSQKATTSTVIPFFLGDQSRMPGQSLHRSFSPSPPVLKELLMPLALGPGHSAVTCQLTMHLAPWWTPMCTKKIWKNMHKIWFVYGFGSCSLLVMPCPALEEHLQQLHGGNGKLRGAFGFPKRVASVGSVWVTTWPKLRKNRGEPLLSVMVQIKYASKFITINRFVAGWTGPEDLDPMICWEAGNSCSCGQLSPISPWRHVTNFRPKTVWEAGRQGGRQRKEADSIENHLGHWRSFTDTISFKVWCDGWSTCHQIKPKGWGPPVQGQSSCGDGPLTCEVQQRSSCDDSHNSAWCGRFTASKKKKTPNACEWIVFGSPPLIEQALFSAHGFAKHLAEKIHVHLVEGNVQQV